MKRLTATTVLCLLLFSAAFVTGKGPSAAPEYPDSLRSVWLYTEGVKQNAIAGDSVRARELFLEAIRNDSTYAPAYYELAANGMYATPDEAVELAFEGLRLFDLYRWKELDKAVANIENERTMYGLAYEARKFNGERDYVWPLPTAELDTNKKLVQHDLWK